MKPSRHFLVYSLTSAQNTNNIKKTHKINNDGQTTQFVLNRLKSHYTYHYSRIQFEFNFDVLKRNK